MTEFGSEAWLGMLTERLGARHAHEPGPLTVEFRVLDAGPEPETFHLVLGDGQDRAVPGPADQSDVTFTVSGATARRIASAELSPEEAFLAGDLRFGGDPEALIVAHRAADDA